MDEVFKGDTASPRERMREAMVADLNAYGLRGWRLDYILRYPELRYLRLLRRVEYWGDMNGIVARIMRGAFRARLLRAAQHTGISLGPYVAGPGLSIPHLGSIVINSGARIGRYCRIHSATNIGVGRGGVPRLGDYVYVAPGAVLYGNITVGDRAVIGANAVVNTDVPAGVTVAGAPARIITSADSFELMPPWIQEIMSKTN